MEITKKEFDPIAHGEVLVARRLINDLITELGICHPSWEGLVEAKRILGGILIHEYGIAFFEESEEDCDRKRKNKPSYEERFKWIAQKVEQDWTFFYSDDYRDTEFAFCIQTPSDQQYHGETMEVAVDKVMAIEKKGWQ